MACTSMRGVQKSFELWAQVLPVGTPSFSRIRQWLLRVGLSVLEHHGPKRSDWIWIIDLTVELGPAKGLVVLGIAQADGQQHVLTHQCSLQHQEVTVLAIEVLETCNGPVIEQTLEQFGPLICQAADLGRREFEHKFHRWLTQPLDLNP